MMSFWSFCRAFEYVQSGKEVFSVFRTGGEECESAGGGGAEGGWGGGGVAV